MIGVIEAKLLRYANVDQLFELAWLQHPKNSLLLDLWHFGKLNS